MTTDECPPASAAGGIDWRPDEMFRLAETPEAVTAARRFVVERATANGAEALSADAAMVAAELLANARQHGLPPVVVRTHAEPGLVRIEVQDANPHPPIRPTPSLSNMTGRGIVLVEAVASDWGTRREPGGGKTVWAELRSDHRVPHAQRTVSVDDDPTTGWPDDADEAEPRFTIVLGDVPTELLIEAKAHIDNLVREFTLAAAGEPAGVAVPKHLAELIETVVHGFAEARTAIKRQALAAASRGEVRTRLTLQLPVSAAETGEAYLAALDEADGYARAGRLLTLETPPEHRLFRRWYVEAVITQLRQAAAGLLPSPVVPFEQRLLDEVRRLSIAQLDSDRAARLQRVTAALVRATTPEDVAAVVVSQGVAVLGASGGSLLVLSEDGEHLAVPGAVGYGEDLVSQLREELPSAQLPAATALRTGEPVWLESPEDFDAAFSELRTFEPQSAALCAVPLMVAGTPVGALRFSFETPKLFDEDERTFVLALAAQTAQTLHRAEIFEAERQAALDLQRELLPEEIPTIPGWDIAAHYSPADGQEVGGDFYDVIALSDGRVAAVVGDVMGRGVRAAAAMARIRSTIRAYVLDDPDPSRVAEKLDYYFAELELGQFVTVIYFLVLPESDFVRVVNAGHLPPVLVTAWGSELVDTSVGLPFGVGGDTRAVSEVALPPGAALVAITDGLVERRGEDMDEGMDRVLRAVSERTYRHAHDILTDIVGSSPAGSGHDDDVTVVVLQRRESTR
ncbi:MAG TPA: SpoIIE family protein phosphatase [Mycobacteriales bacterium]|nr:SpoIIE family protein phosphatase [Mycobacteriales bacterium]